NGSIFVVFSNGITAPPAESVEYEPIKTLDAPWSARFDPKLGGPQEIVFDKLAYWNESAEPGVKYYSGTAVYSTEFELTPEQARERLALSLGKLHDIARVKFNGRDLGIAWTAPMRVELGSAARAGKNTLEIEVCNCWRNRLIGDAALEPAERVTKTNVVLEKEAEKMPVYRGYVSSDPLEPSGLLGPVAVEKATSR
ncbi:MAG: hypothetical protein IIU43_04320, partial [Thermoguttaceae bacterium]|nr:hypothetical protein [Thermoguttaceae bacterium]